MYIFEAHYTNMDNNEEITRKIEFDGQFMENDKECYMVRSIDLARHMGFSKPSISHAVGVLKNGGFLTVDDDGFLHLTVIGREIAEKIYERHLFFMEQFIAAGVDQETAEQDACRIEHAISDTSFRKLKEKVQGTD